jgi:hypothetical protein
MSTLVGHKGDKVVLIQIVDSMLTELLGDPQPPQVVLATPDFWEAYDAAYDVLGNRGFGPVVRGFLDVIEDALCDSLWSRHLYVIQGAVLAMLAHEWVGQNWCVAEGYTVERHEFLLSPVEGFLGHPLFPIHRES